MNNLFGLSDAQMTRLQPFFPKPDPISEAGQPVVLMETRQVNGALKAMPIKTDRRDAEVRLHSE